MLRKEHSAESSWLSNDLEYVSAKVFGLGDRLSEHE